MPAADVDNGLLLFRRKQSFEKRNGEDLIGAEGAVVAHARTANHAVTTAALRVPEFLKTLRSFGGQHLVAFARLSEQARKLRHRLERVDPKRIDFHGLPCARGND